MQEMRTRVSRITQDLNALLQELATVPEEHASELIEKVLTPEITKGFESSLDAVRRLLWSHIGAASRQSKSTTPSETLPGGIEVRVSMEGSGPAQGKGSVGTFIEKVEAIVQKKIPTLQKDEDQSHGN